MGRSDQPTTPAGSIGRCGRPEAARILLVCWHLDGGGPMIFGIDGPWNGVAAPRSGRGPSTATRCVPAGLRWSRPAACAGSPHVPSPGAHDPLLPTAGQHKDAPDRGDLVGDNSYACWICSTTRCIALDAGQRHPVNLAERWKGPRRPPLKVFLEQTDVTWSQRRGGWYDGITRAVELTSQTAVWAPASAPRPHSLGADPRNRHSPWPAAWTPPTFHVEPLGVEHRCPHRPPYALAQPRGRNGAP